MVTYEVSRVDDDRTVYLHKRLDQALRRVRDYTVNDDDDSLIFVDGKEGSGKSKTARQIGYVLAKWNNTSFGLENIHNSLDSYMKGVMGEDASRDLPSGRVHILDESKNVLNKMRQTSKSNVDFTNFMSENRDFNVHHIICAPAFHDIDPNTAKWRMNFLIHMLKQREATDDRRYKSGERLDRGEFKAYQNKSELIRAYNNPYSYPDEYQVRGRFKDVEVLSDEELERYREQKREEMRSKFLRGSGFKDLTAQAIAAVLSHAKSERAVSRIYDEYSEALSMAKRTFRDKINGFLDEEFDGGLEL